MLERLEKFIATHIEKNPKKRSDNIIEATYLYTLLKKLTGTAVFFQDITVDYKVIRKFSYLGLVGFIILYSLYYYCAYTSYIKNQSITHDLFETKLKHYGDFFEWLVATSYTTYNMYKLPFSISGCTLYLQIIVDADIILKEMGEVINYVAQAKIIFCYGLLQATVATIHLISLYICLMLVGKNLPHALICQVIISDALALATTTHYCYYLNLLKIRYKIINQRLHKMSKNRTNGNVRNERRICRDILKCGKIYDMMFKAAAAADNVFGLALIITMFTNVLFIILNMFYFMEAHVHLLFLTDFDKYVLFMIYITWEVSYAMLIIIMNIYYCEHAMNAVSLLK